MSRRNRRPLGRKPTPNDPPELEGRPSELPTRTVMAHLQRAETGAGIAIMGGTDRRDGLPSIVLLVYRRNGDPVALTFSEEAIEGLLGQIRDELAAARAAVQH